jgi:hypothetical protein
MKTALVTVGILLVLASLPFLFFANLGACWNGCTGAQELGPMLVLLVPAAYIAGSIAYVRARRRRALRDPAFAARATGAGQAIAIGVVVLLLALAAMFVTCAAVVFR